jgi:hypothetical protein
MSSIRDKGNDERVPEVGYEEYGECCHIVLTRNFCVGKQPT